jgi:hypothetical protein
MTADVVTARLRAMSEASRLEPSPMRRDVDMSPAALTSRLREMADVSRLCAKLVDLGKQLRHA